jgi:hypothetical protein
MINAIGSIYEIGFPQEAGNLPWQYNFDATNESGFTALPGGLKDFTSTSGY